MSAFIPNGIMKSKDISPTAKLVYGKMCKTAKENGECLLSQESIASDMGMSIRNIVKIIKELKNKNLIGVIRRGPKDTNMYVFYDHPLMHKNSGG